MAQFSKGGGLALIRVKTEGVFLREKGGFAAIGIAEKENRDCWWIVHEQLLMDDFTSTLHFRSRALRAYACC